MQREGSPRETPQPADEENESTNFLRILLAILLPPLGVFLQVGIGSPFWINVILTLLGYVPGIVHAVWVVATRGPTRSSV